MRTLFFIFLAVTCVAFAGKSVAHGQKMSDGTVIDFSKLVTATGESCCNKTDCQIAEYRFKEGMVEFHAEVLRDEDAGEDADSTNVWVVVPHYKQVAGPKEMSLPSWPKDKGIICATMRDSSDGVREAEPTCYAIPAQNLSELFLPPFWAAFFISLLGARRYRSD